MAELHARHRHREGDGETERRRKKNTGNYQSRQQIGAFKKTHSYEDVWQHFSAFD